MKNIIAIPQMVGPSINAHLFRALRCWANVAQTVISLVWAPFLLWEAWN